MARLIDRSFQPNEPVVARRFFVAAGRHYTPGDVFDWKRLAVDARRVRLLFEAGKLMHPEGEVVPEPEVVLTPAPAIEQEVQDEDILAVAAETPADTEDDGLDDLNMKELREIADAEGAPFRVSREAQRDAIRENRRVQE
jgi:hypothetical protein